MHEVVVDGRKNRRTVPSWKTSAPDVHLGRAPDKVRRTVVVGLFVGHPDLSAKNTSQPSNPQSRHRRDASVQIVRRQGAAPEIVEIFVRIGVVIAGNPPDVGKRHRFAQKFLQRSARLRVAENHHGVGPVEAGRLVDVRKLSVRIAAEENVRKLFGTMLTPTTSPTFRSLLLLVTHDASFFPRAVAPEAPHPSIHPGAQARLAKEHGKIRLANKCAGGLGLPFFNVATGAPGALPFLQSARRLSSPSGFKRAGQRSRRRNQWLRKAHYMRRQWKAL